MSEGAIPEKIVAVAGVWVGGVWEWGVEGGEADRSCHWQMFFKAFIHQRPKKFPVKTPLQFLDLSLYSLATFLQSQFDPLEIPSPHPPLCLDFFWNSPISN